MPGAAVPDRPEILRPDPEVLAKPKKRTYTAEYKRRVLDALDACTKPGEQAAILRREGLYLWAERLFGQVS